MQIIREFALSVQAGDIALYYFRCEEETVVFNDVFQHAPSAFVGGERETNPSDRGDEESRQLSFCRTFEPVPADLLSSAMYPSTLKGARIYIMIEGSVDDYMLAALGSTHSLQPSSFNPCFSPPKRNPMKHLKGQEGACLALSHQNERNLYLIKRACSVSVLVRNLSPFMNKYTSSKIDSDWDGESGMG